MAYIVLPESGIPLTRKDVWALPNDELKTPVIAVQLTADDITFKKGLSNDPAHLIKAEIKKNAIAL